MSGDGVLRSRLRPPRVPSGAIARPALLSACLRGTDLGRLFVVAGAGFGKSTLLAQVVHAIPLPTAWCSCDAKMRSPMALANHLNAAVAEHVPGFGSESAGPTDAEGLAAALCNEIDATVPDDIVLILDDVHLLEGSAAETVVERLITDLPPQVRLVISGRHLPPRILDLGPAASMKLDEARLAMDLDEAAALLRSVGLDVEDRLLRDLHRRTEGWPAGLLIAAQSGSDLRTAVTARGPLFAYLAQEVLDRLEARTRRFLEDTALLSRLTPELCAAVAGTSAERARAQLEWLCDSHLFTHRIEGTGRWFRYHHLLTEHLRDRLHEGDPGRVRELHRRAGQAWLAMGEAVEGLRHLAAAGASEGLADGIDRFGEVLVNGPDTGELLEWVALVPAPGRRDRPGLLLAQATALNTEGRFEEAFTQTEEAVERLVALGEHDRAAVVLVRLLINMLAAGTPPDRRIVVGERWVPELDPVPALPVLRIAHAAGLAFGGRQADAEREIGVALEAAGTCPYPLEAYARIMRAFYLEYPRGRGGRAVEMLEQSAAELLTDPDRDVFGYGPYAVAYLPYVLNSLGRYEDALVAASRVEAEFRARRFPEMAGRVVKWWRLTALAGLERWEQLGEEMVPPARALTPNEATHYGYRYRAPAALLAAHHGDADAVVAHITAAREEMAQHGASFDHPWILCDLSAAALSAGLSTHAAELARGAHDLAVAQDLPWGRARSALRLAAALDPGGDGDRYLAEALEITARETFTGLWVRRERGVAAAMLARAIERDLGDPGQAVGLVTRCGPQVITECAERLVAAPLPVRIAFTKALAGHPGVPADVLDRLARDRAPEIRAAASVAQAGPVALRFRVLGGLSVERDGAPVDRSAFGREKARALLAALLCASGPVHREVLLEWFWPDLDTERALRAFHVTLHALRRALEPELPRGATSSVIRVEGEAYRLTLRDTDAFDLGAFLEMANDQPGATPSDRLARLLKAERLWTGEVLPEWPYAEWAAPVRGQADHARVTVLAGLAETLLQAGRPGEAVIRAKELVSREPVREEWHRLLMRAYSGSGERPLALRQFHACRAVLRRELGLEAGPDTRRLYQEILLAEDAEGHLRAEDS